MRAASVDVKRTRKPLLDWYRANKRAMPWRETSDPYAIWISEAMLQQTRVDTVIPYYERFLARFPGRVLYAVKANPAEAVLDGLHGAGIRPEQISNLIQAAGLTAIGIGVND